MMLDNNQQAFIALVQSGLWERETLLSEYGKIDYMEVYRLAEEQSVVGIVAVGLEHVVDVKVPQEELLQFVGSALQIEQQNVAMNQFIVKLIEKLRRFDIYALLLKGQGIAQCYERPLWRTPGDVDLLLNDENYIKAERLLSPLASSIEDEISYAKHKALAIDEWTVELHGSLRSGLWRKVDRVLDKIQYDIFCGGNVRSWFNGKTQVFIPRADEDVVYVFSHILQHFYKEGIGLRQICDWCRLLWTYKDTLNQGLLESRIRKMGLMSEWKAFAALAVDYLGMPVVAMPLYDGRGKMEETLMLDGRRKKEDVRWRKKAERIMEFVLETGNFGHNRDYDYFDKYPYLVYKTISFWKHIKDGYRYFRIFPQDSLKVMARRMIVGFSVVIRGKRRE